MNFYGICVIQRYLRENYGPSIDNSSLFNTISGLLIVYLCIEVYFKALRSK